MLSAYACSAPGQSRLRSLRPQPSLEHVAAERSLYAECLLLRRAGVDFPRAEFESPEEALTRATPARAVLDPQDFIIVRQMLRVAGEVRRVFTPEKESLREKPAMQALIASLDTCPELCQRLDSTFADEKGMIRDQASERLRQIRTRMDVVEKNIRTRLETMLNSPDLADVFQEHFVTTRHGRYVVPVRRELRTALKGIVHDQSNTGNTLFVEPETVVELGNELECLRLEERAEIQRILKGLTAILREHLGRLWTNFERLCQYDMAFAVSAWALEYECDCPEVGDALRLVGARHPLLQRQLNRQGRGAALVPLDLEVPPGKNVIVITGSNTGGKTVALKTVGLLTLIAQTGLPIPARSGSMVRFFTNVLADIGDEQSIEQSLSTFGAHLQNIVGILELARTNTALVLLDELGAGTDPIEGGALGCALLAAFSATSGLTLATTHLGAVKRFVHEHPRMENASMLFNVESLQPEYRLLMGRAGASYALTVAERCGLPREIVAMARSFVNAPDAKLESMLIALDHKQLRLEREMRALEQARLEAEYVQYLARREHATISEKLKGLSQKRRQILEAAQREAAALVANTRREMEQLLSRAKQVTDREEARNLRRQIASREATITAYAGEPKDTAPAEDQRTDLKVGDIVWVESLQDHGTVIALNADGQRVKIKVGNLYCEVKREAVGPRRGPLPPAAPAPAPLTVSAEPQPAVSRELNLIGERVSDAMVKLERFLDAARLAGLPEVRVVHGYGTGALRRAVHAYLDSAPNLRYRLGQSDRDPGGSGVTIIELAR